MLLSIVLPCYNPTNEWANNVLSKFHLLEAEVKDTQLIIVNDGSLNFTQQEFNNQFSGFGNITCITYSGNKGKGFALRQGVNAATGSLIIYTDIDFPYTHESFLKVYTVLKSEAADIVVGVRSPQYYAHLPGARVLISKLFRWLVEKLIRIPVNDTQCGLKGFNQKGKEVFLQTTINRYLFDLEFIFLAARKKLAIKTVEVELRPEIILSKMNWKILMQEFGNFLKIFVKSI